MRINFYVNDAKYSRELSPGSNIIEVPVTKHEVINRIKGGITVKPAEKMFFNGYQTWTHCPEYSKHDRIRGLHGLPRKLIDKYALDRYADYHFVSYPNKRGVFHGFSYCYFRNGDRYLLFASLDETPGYTMFKYSVRKSTLMIERDSAGLEFTEDSYHAFDLFIAEGTEKEVFDCWFDALGIHNSVPGIKGYSSWYNHYQDINEKTIGDDLEGAKKIFDENDLFQVDDGWEPFVGDWEITDTTKFPDGLKPISDSIHAAGFKAGLWLAPFVAEEKSATFREHPDWFLQYKGEPWKDGSNWSGFYSLDIDNPDVQAYLRNVFNRVFNEWGFDLVKLDFLYAAAPFATGDHGNGSDVPYTESRAGRMIRALKFLRALCKDKLILGCGTPVMPAFGLVDYCRVGCDAGLDWNDKLLMRIIHRERVSTKHCIHNTVFRRQLDNRAHGNDPDVFFLRDENISLTEEEKNYLAAVDAMFGSVWLTSDDLNRYDETRINIYKGYEKLRNAQDKKIDPDTLDISYTSDGSTITIKYPHRR